MFHTQSAASLWTHDTDKDKEILIKKAYQRRKDITQLDITSWNYLQDKRKKQKRRKEAKKGGNKGRIGEKGKEERK